jgi:16S rRNA (uracil1498-N3)-methyltransferase
MAIPRFYVPGPWHTDHPIDHLIALPETVARHATGALRMREGDALSVFDGLGRAGTGELMRDGKSLYAKVSAYAETSRESPLDITLVQGISSGDRMDYTLQKAVELGVRAIVPVFMKRSIVRLSEERLARRHAHWQGIVIAACEQCGRNTLPAVAAPCAFDAWLASAPPHLTLLLDPEAADSLRSIKAPSGPVILLAGPEGGFDPGERRAITAHGGTGVRLGPRVLRTETAALAALAAMQALWGDF